MSKWYLPKLFPINFKNFIPIWRNEIQPFKSFILFFLLKKIKRKINYRIILILVVGKFTCFEQKLLNKIKTNIQSAKINKPLFIIHNLFIIFSKKQLEDNMNDYLLKSVTFEWEKGNKISTGKLSKKMDFIIMEKIILQQYII